MIIFAEGTRHDNNELLPFKKGAFHMSVQSDMRILPVVIQKYPFLNHGEKIFGTGEVQVEILSPMEKLDNESVDDFARRVCNVMNFEFQRISNVDKHVCE